MNSQNICWFTDLSLSDVAKVGGKNASLGELYANLRQAGVEVPNGFATPADAYWQFLKDNNLREKINNQLDTTSVDDIQQLTQSGQTIRNWILNAEFSSGFINDITNAYNVLVEQEGASASFAVRSSATAEDLPNASFAGQQETYLNVKGIDNILKAIKAVFASLYNDRAISYRVHHGFRHDDVAISAGVQRMVRSDLASSGVLFTLDTESGFDQVVFITASYGLGEAIVQGAVNPDEYYAYKPNITANRPAIVRRNIGSKQIKMVYDENSDFRLSVKTVDVDLEDARRYALNNDELTTLAKYAMQIEAHYGCPMDIEWAKDGNDNKIYILQARPETVKSRKSQQHQRFEMKEKGVILCMGRSIGQRIGQGKARVITSLEQMKEVETGDVLIADMTDPDWEPVMKKASAIVTNRGGRTCHAAIIARELGIPAVVGCVDATSRVQHGVDVTVSCAEGDTGYVYAEKLAFQSSSLDVQTAGKLPVKISMNVANPERAFTFQALPNDGVGLARLEFIISNTIGIHPRALIEYEKLPLELKAQIQPKIAAYASPIEYYIERLVEGISTIACAFANKPVIVRLSDFKSNEYAGLLGGHLFEPTEENPMIGFRGASRYISKEFSECFALECQAIKRVRNDMGLTNVEVMIPFVRTVSEAKNVIDVLEKNGLKRGENGLRVIMMCEVPSNALLAEQFLQYFDGFSIGSNDLTQLTLGLDRDSALVANYFDERDPAVKALLSMAIQTCLKNKKYIGICGQGPSDHPDFAKWLIEQGINALSLNPDTVLPFILSCAPANPPAA